MPGHRRQTTRGRLAMNAPSFEQLAALAPSLGIIDATCPLCSAVHNPRRRVLRIWRDHENFIGFACARCGEKGWARSSDKGTALSPERRALLHRDIREREAAELARSRQKALWLWGTSLPVKPTTHPWVYLR